LQLVQVRNIGRTRARTLAKRGIRTPADLLGMTNKDLDAIKSLRGWGPVMVERMMEEVRKLAGQETVVKQRTDDLPLPGERDD